METLNHEIVLSVSVNLFPLFSESLILLHREPRYRHKYVSPIAFSLRDRAPNLKGENKWEASWTSERLSLYSGILGRPDDEYHIGIKAALLPGVRGLRGDGQAKKDIADNSLHAGLTRKDFFGGPAKSC